MAMSLNKATIIGNLTRDVEMKTIASGQPVATFGVATGRQYTDKNGAKQEETEFHNVVAWGKLAEICSQYIGKGRKVYVEGRLRTREWEGQDGIKRQRTEIIAENVIMLDRAPATGGAQGQGGGSYARPAQPQNTAPKQAPGMDLPTISLDDAPSPKSPSFDDEIRIEDIPF